MLTCILSRRLKKEITPPKRFAASVLANVAVEQSWKHVLDRIESYRKSLAAAHLTEPDDDLKEFSSTYARESEPDTKQLRISESTANALNNISKQQLCGHIEWVPCDQAKVDAGITATLMRWLGDERSDLHDRLENIFNRCASEVDVLRRVLRWDREGQYVHKLSHMMPLMLSFLQSLLKELLALRGFSESDCSEHDVCDVRERGNSFPLYFPPEIKGYTDLGRLVRELLVNHFELKKPLELYQEKPSVDFRWVRQFLGESEAIGRRVVTKSPGKKPGCGQEAFEYRGAESRRGSVDRWVWLSLRRPREQQRQ